MMLKPQHAGGKAPEPAKREPMAEGHARARSVFSESEVEHLVRRREELAAQGMNDDAIIKALTCEMGRGFNSIRGKMTKMIMSGAMAKNPNNRQEMGAEEVEAMMRRRGELVEEGMNDTEISRVLASELGRNEESAYDRIKKLVAGGRLAKNRNNHERSAFTPERVKLLIQRREELAGQGMNDERIGKELAPEIGGSAASITQKIRELAAEGILAENGVKRKITPFSEEDTELVIRRWKELAAEGKRDKEICKALGKEMGRSGGSIGSKILHLREERRLTENPNLRKTNKFSESQVGTAIRRRNELSEQGKRDAEIGRMLAKEMGVNADSIGHLIRRLVEDGRLARNSNMTNRKPNGFYSKMDDISLVRHARGYMSSAGIGGRRELEKGDAGLYQTLRNRKLLDDVFARIESFRHADAINGVLDALGSFGDER